MDNTLFIPTLEELSLVNISITLWSQKRLEIYTRKYVKEDLFCKKKKKLPYRMRKALELVTESIYNLEIPLSLMYRLIDKSERIGHELFLFMNESCLNCSHLKFFTSDNFCQHDLFDLNLSDDIKWKSNGEIFYTNTLASCMRNHPNGSSFLFFLSACQNCDEIIIFDLWEKFSEEQKKQIEDTLVLDLCGYNLSSDSKILLSYWLSKLKNSFDNFISRINFRIDNRNSLDYNLLIYSLNSSFRNRVLYFYLNLTETEKERFVEILDMSGKKILALEQIKASYKFFEAPVLNHRINQFIIDMLSEDSFEYLIDYCISNLMSFGDLHGNVILYLMLLAPYDVKKWTLNDLNFYLQLIECGQFKIVKSLLDEETKKLVREEILSDEALLNQSTNVFINYVQSIHRNGYYDSLVDFFNIVSDDNDLMAVLVIGTEKADIQIDRL